MMFEKDTMILSLLKTIQILPIVIGKHEILTQIFAVELLIRDFSISRSHKLFLVTFMLQCYQH